MKCLYITLLSITLLGCAPTNMYHDTKPVDAFDADLYDCETIAKQRTADAGYPGNIFIENDETLECMKRKHGWKTEK